MSYGAYGASIFMGNNMVGPVKTLDVNNEFIGWAYNDYWYAVLSKKDNIYVVFSSYNNAMEMIYGENKERSNLVECLTRNRKSILSIP